MIYKGKGSDKMDKNKKIGLVILLVIGILICTWSIYNSVITMNQSSNSTTELANNTTSNSNNNGSPVIIDDDNDDIDDDTSTTNKEPSSEEDVFNNDQDESTEKYIIYTVEKDETLKDICEKYADNCPIPVLSKAILKINNLSSSSKISEGKKIKIPEKYINTGIKYTVRSGDSLSSIAMRFMKDIDYSEALEIIKQDNFLTSDTIKIGDELFIRADDILEVNNKLEDEEDEVNDSDKKASKNKKVEDKDSEATSKNQDQTDNSAAMNSITNRIGNLVTYTVKKNDTLKSIAENYDRTCPVNVASKIILEINGLESSSDIKEGMKIKLPERYLSEGSIYKVKAGDTLSNIVIENMPGIDYNLALKIIVEDNDIKNYTIYPNQELFIASID